MFFWKPQNLKKNLPGPKQYRKLYLEPRRPSTTLLCYSDPRGKRALGGGVAGASAMVLQVCYVDFNGDLVCHLME